jgi:2-polyprenyl-6-hydroxyphenyl methylase/3-demethylubiquinone-9 3-methyltransferase
MTKAATDRELAIDAPEFAWTDAGLSEVHGFILPVLRRWLGEAKDESVLDLGCGNGALARELARLGWRVAGLDSSASGIRLARETAPEFQFERADLATPLGAGWWGRFDAVLAIEVIEHLLLPRQLFARAREAMKPHGRLIVSTPFHGYWKNLALALTNGFDRHWHPLRDYGHVKFFSLPTLTQLFEEQGFEVARVRRVGRVPPLARSIMVEGILP